MAAQLVTSLPRVADTLRHMDQTTYFSFRCPVCTGRARVASRHAGQVIVCPYCQANATAVPDTRPTVVPSPAHQHVSRDADGNPATTSRVARPLDPVTTATIRRQRAADRFGTEVLPQMPQMSQATAPGMAGFADNRAPSAAAATATVGTASITRRQVAPTAPAPSNAAPGTASISRNTQRPAPAPAPAPASQVPFMWTATAAAILTAVSIWACVDASTQRTRWQLAKQQAEDATTELTHVKTTAEELDKRLAQAQVELAAARAATARERELVTDLQKTNGRLAEELVKSSHANDAPLLTTTPTSAGQSTMLATGFPTPLSPSAGVPARTANR